MILARFGEVDLDLLSATCAIVVSSTRMAGASGGYSATARWTSRNQLPRSKEEVIKIGAKVVGHARCVAFQMTEIAISKNLFARIYE